MTNGATSSQTITYADQLSSSVISLVCRICYDTEKDEDLITPCNCKVITGNNRAVARQFKRLCQSNNFLPFKSYIQ